MTCPLPLHPPAATAPSTGAGPGIATADPAARPGTALRASPAPVLPAALLCAAFAPGAAWAQAAAETTLPEVRVESTATGFRTESGMGATRTDTPLRDTPQFVNQVPQAVLHSQGATTLTDALRNAPGISYAAAEGGTQANQVLYLRGFPVNQDVYIDGIRDMGEYNRDLFATESVEVLKGPSSLLFGRGGSGGVINQVGKTADLQPRKELELKLGSRHQQRLTGDMNLRLGEESALRLIVLQEKSGFYRYPQDVEKSGFAPSFWRRIGARTEATLSWYHLDSSDVTDYGQPTLPAAITGTGQAAMPPVAASRYYGLANHDYAKHQTDILTFRLEHAFDSGPTLKNNLRWAGYRRQMEATISTLRATDANGAPVTSGTPLGLLVVTRNHDGNRTRDNDDHALINQTDLLWKFAALGVRHQLLTGVELSREQLNRWNYTLDADPATAGVQTPASVTPLLNPDPYSFVYYTKTPNLRARSQGDVLALYAQDQVEINRWWKALAGLRWERFTGQAKTESIATGATVAGPFRRTDRMVSGRAGLIFQPDERQAYYASLANSFNPSGELGVYAGTAQTNLTATNEALEPEENRNLEVGTTQDFAGGLQLRATAFRTEKINQRINDSITGVTILAGKRRVQGLELQLSGAITPRWDVYAGAALQGGRIVKSTANQGNTPLGVPDYSGNVWTVYRLGGGWEVGGGLTASSGFWLTDANNGKVPSYVTADLTAARVQKDYELRLNVYNLADKLHYLGGYQNSPNRVVPGQPRSLALTLRHSFN